MMRKLMPPPCDCCAPCRQPKAAVAQRQLERCPVLERRRLSARLPGERQLENGCRAREDSALCATDCDDDLAPVRGALEVRHAQREGARQHQPLALCAKGQARELGCQRRHFVSALFSELARKVVRAKWRAVEHDALRLVLHAQVARQGCHLVRGAGCQSALVVGKAEVATVCPAC